MVVVDARGQVHNAIKENGQMRLSELREEVGFHDVSDYLIELVEEGKVAILPVGEVVVIRPEEEE
jgi:predicted transcriptional regulator